MPNGVIIDSVGNLYGATFAGGDGSRTGVQEGVVFKLDPAGNETVLHSFTGLSDGGAPESGVVRDAAGNLYGTASAGGLGAGVIFEVDPSGKEVVLYAFGGGADGGTPLAGLTRDSAGNLYGTAANYGELGDGDQGSGVVFEFRAGGLYSVLYTFTGGADGGLPSTALARDPAGNLYGTANFGGGLGYGVVYVVDPSGDETVLHTFTGYGDGGDPYSGVILGPDGSLYGTTPEGGLGTSTWRAPGEGFGGAGVAYRINLP
jgi:uncharacterized repeat protein (TIGR03803 family)